MLNKRTDAPNVSAVSGGPGVIAMSDGYTIRLVDVTNLRPRDVHLLDITHHLAYMRRYGGLGDAPSVAQHTVEAYEWAMKWADARGWNADDKALLAKHVLIHDMPEAYTGDVRAPLASLPMFAALKALQEQHRVVICYALGVEPHPAYHIVGGVRMADLADAKREQHGILPRHECWGTRPGSDEDDETWLKETWSPLTARNELRLIIRRVFGADVLPVGVNA